MVLIKDPYAQMSRALVAAAKDEQYFQTDSTRSLLRSLPATTPNEPLAIGVCCRGTRFFHGKGEHCA